ncbi:MAG TPA: cytochrome P450 [Acidimicrobiales bacterium]|nr:cytochrome P450 [Acidimicrobiales bacterium]
MTDSHPLVVEDEHDPFEAFERAQGGAVRDPHAEWARLREQGPVHKVDLRKLFGLDTTVEIPDAADLPESYLVLGYDEVAHVLRDGQTFSSTGYAASMGVVMGHTILEMDEPEHHRYRGLVQQAFTRKAMERWETELVAPIVNRLIDDFAGGRADLVRDLFFVFPVYVIAGLLGLPDEDLPAFHRLAVELISVSFDWERGVAASERLREYFAGVLGERRREPAEDIISALSQAELDGIRLTDEEIFAFLRLLLPAGAETTYRSSSNLLFGLLTHPDQLEALRQDRSLLPQAIEEGLRWEPPLTGIMRLTTRDVELGGVDIAAGAILSVNMGAANRDPGRWPHPERFDVFRPPQPHISFALGPHTCLGMHLARMETTVAVNIVLDRLVGMRLDPDARDVHIRGVAFRAPARLPVMFGARGGT